MSDPETAFILAQRLRIDAAVRLNDAAQCGDPAQRDGMVEEALALLDRARLLRREAERNPEAPDSRGAEAGLSSRGMP